MNANQHRLAAAISTAGRVLARLQESLDEGADFAALSSGGRDERRSVDAFLQRFQQSVEVMARRLFGAIYRVAEADRPPPVMTLLAYLEGLGVIADERAWSECIEIRNALAHEYPDTPEDRADAIGRAQQASPSILRDHAAALAFVARQRLLGDPA